MVIDGLKAYVQLASGLTDVTRERALAVARTLVAQGEAGVGAVLPDTMRTQVASVTDDLIATSKANRDLLVGLVRAEVERTVSRMGLVSAAELNAATRRAEALDDRVHELERALRSARSAPTAQKSATKKATKKATSRKSTAKKSATKTSAKKSAKKSTSRKSTAKKSVTRTSG
jgi:polyhydroxyalkanoate synthesis regulator phasin